MFIPYTGPWHLTGQPQDYQTYRIAQGADIVVKDACEVVKCEAWQFGWDTIVDETTELGRAQAHYIRTMSGRDFRELKSETGGTVFRFPPRQRCFAEHRTRPQFFSVRYGDNRAWLGLKRRHTRFGDWVEDSAEHQLRLVDQRKEGAY
jgi:hypothetical protein